MAVGQSRDGDPAVQQVLDLLGRSLTSRGSPGSGWFAEAMRGLPDVAVAEANGAGRP